MYCKTVMYDFHYNYLKKKYGDKSKLLFTNADSLTYEIETDVYKGFWNDRHKFDNSDYPENSKFYVQKIRESSVNSKIKQLV